MARSSLRTLRTWSNRFTATCEAQPRGPASATTSIRTRSPTYCKIVNEHFIIVIRKSCAVKQSFHCIVRSSQGYLAGLNSSVKRRWLDIALRLCLLASLLEKGDFSWCQGKGRGGLQHRFFWWQGWVQGSRACSWCKDWSMIRASTAPQHRNLWVSQKSISCHWYTSLSDNQFLLMCCNVLHIAVWLATGKLWQKSAAMCDCDVWSSQAINDLASSCARKPTAPMAFTEPIHPFHKMIISGVSCF